MEDFNSIRDVKDHLRYIWEYQHNIGLQEAYDHLDKAYNLGKQQIDFNDFVEKCL
jgi:hypothetical protein